MIVWKKAGEDFSFPAIVIEIRGFSEETPNCYENIKNFPIKFKKTYAKM